MHTRISLICASAVAVATGASTATASVLVDSNWNIFSSNYNAYAAVDSGRSLMQSFTLDRAYTIENLWIYASASSAKLYITGDLGQHVSRNDMLWTGSLSNTSMGWQEFDAEQVSLGPGTYYLVLEADMPSTSAAKWARATASGRMNLGDLGLADFNPGGFAPSNDFTMVNGASLTLRMTGFEAVVPTPGAAALLGMAGLAAFRRRR